jgi:tricarballylate dehydrogenase
MALDVGAQSHGHWSCAHACECDLHAPAYGEIGVGDAYSKHSYPLAIMLNSAGRRFLDEGADIRNYTYAKYGRIILEQPGQSCWQVFDAKVLPLLASQYRGRKVTKVTANTLEELVKKLEGIDCGQALKTIAEYNAAVKRDVPFDPNIKDGRGTTGLAIPKSNWAQTIDVPPFEAYPVTCGITFTFGGLRISLDAEVLDEEEQAIPGLYAAGELVGGIFYFNYPGGSGLMNGAVYGRIAGGQAAHYANRSS